MRFMVVLLAGVALLLAACGGDGGGGDQAGDTTPEGTEADGDPAVGEEISGVLRGDAQLEGGCAWLETDAGNVEVFYPPGYEIAFDPVRLVGPDGEVVATEGEQVTVRGQAATDMASICQVGTLFQATEVRV